jgi:predicted TIM-barrel fold metal-dependent hydrolase
METHGSCVTFPGGTKEREKQKSSKHRMPTALQDITLKYNLQIILAHYNPLFGCGAFSGYAIARVNHKA